MDATIPLQTQRVVGKLIQEITVMGYDDQAALEGEQELFQLIQGKEVQVVGGLIQDQKIGIFDQHRQKVQPAELSPAELGDHLVLGLGGKHKMFQEMGSGDGPPILHMDHFGNLLHRIDNPLLLFPCLPHLAVISHHHRFSKVDGPGILGHHLRDHIQEGGLSGSIPANDAYPFSFGKFVGKPLITSPGDRRLLLSPSSSRILPPSLGDFT